MSRTPFRGLAKRHKRKIRDKIDRERNYLETIEIKNLREKLKKNIVVFDNGDPNIAEPYLIVLFNFFDFPTWKSSNEMASVLAQRLKDLF